MKTLVLILFINVAAFGQNVGDISFDATKDNPDFKLCNPSAVWQGYWLKTKMDETTQAVEQEFKGRFQTKDEWKNESGLIRIRFVVNCQGQSDRFRLLELDFDLNEKKFSESLRAHLLTVAKGIQWPARRANQQTMDYYHHFSIRITNGQLTDIIQ